ncbi:hypothetical protein [Flavisericum labens]|uniref:hypothetical protein n=1 Tax=Flavisericum labens TaxID=3377112 RepID=UPI00387AAD0A
MSAGKHMEELLKRIYMPSVFYFPKALFPNLSAETRQMLDVYGFFEDTGILKANGDVGSITTPVNALEIYKKEDVLNGNLFQLLEIKEGHQNKSFGFLFEKYLSQVKTWAGVYDWLLNNLEKQIPQEYHGQKPLFEYQCIVLDKHLTMLDQEFQFNIDETATTNVVDILAENEAILPISGLLSNDLQASRSGEAINKKQKVTKPSKKPLLLTEQEADEYLLERVFNVKLG